MDCGNFFAGKEEDGRLGLGEKLCDLIESKEAAFLV